MSKVNIFFYVLAVVSFLYNVIRTSDTLIDIGKDFDNYVYVYVGQKEYTKENVIKYYKQVLRYVNYFIFFYDFENIESIIDE